MVQVTWQGDFVDISTPRREDAPDMWQNGSKLYCHSFHVVLPNLNHRVVQGETQDVGNEPERRDIANEVLSAIRADIKVSAVRLAKRLAVSCRTIERVMSVLRKEGRIRRVGGTRGHWEVCR